MPSPPGGAHPPRKTVTQGWVDVGPTSPTSVRLLPSIGPALRRVGLPRGQPTDPIISRPQWPRPVRHSALFTASQRVLWTFKYCPRSDLNLDRGHQRVVKITISAAPSPDEGPEYTLLTLCWPRRRGLLILLWKAPRPPGVKRSSSLAMFVCSFQMWKWITLSYNRFGANLKYFVIFLKFIGSRAICTNTS